MSSAKDEGAVPPPTGVVAVAMPPPSETVSTPAPKRRYEDAISPLSDPESPISKKTASIRRSVRRRRHASDAACDSDSTQPKKLLDAPMISRSASDASLANKGGAITGPEENKVNFKTQTSTSSSGLELNSSDDNMEVISGEPNVNDQTFLSSTLHNSKKYRQKERSNPPQLISQSASDSSRRRSWNTLSTTVPATFADYPVILFDVKDSPVMFSKLDPWRMNEAIKQVCGPVSSIRRLHPGRVLVGCKDERQQNKLHQHLEGKDSRLGGVLVTHRVPVAKVEGVIGPFDGGVETVSKIKKDLQDEGYHIDGVYRLNNRKGEPSRAIRVVFRSSKLPSELSLACSVYRVTPYCAPVRRCTKCQLLGHTRTQCRARQPHCARCSAPGHTDDACSAADFCRNCHSHHKPSSHQCPEYEARSIANRLRAESYIPFSLALARARVTITANVKPAASAAPPPASPRVGSAWHRNTARPLHLGTEKAQDGASRSGEAPTKINLQEPNPQPSPTSTGALHVSGGSPRKNNCPPVKENNGLLHPPPAPPAPPSPISPASCSANKPNNPICDNKHTVKEKVLQLDKELEKSKKRTSTNPNSCNSFQLRLFAYGLLQKIAALKENLSGCNNPPNNTQSDGGLLDFIASHLSKDGYKGKIKYTRYMDCLMVLAGVRDKLCADHDKLPKF